MTTRNLLIVLILITAALAFIEPHAWVLNSWLFQRGTSTQSRETALETQNENLKAQIAILEDIKSSLVPISSTGVTALVYSGNPFNFQSELVLNRGHKDGVFENQAVLYSPPASVEVPYSFIPHGVLVGKIHRVFESYSTATTLFDPAWQMPVRIGAGGIDALLTGGRKPKLSLIAKGAPVAPYDIVYSAAEGFAYGIPVGEIKEVFPSADGLFEEAWLTTPYQVEDLHVVVIQNDEAD